MVFNTNHAPTLFSWARSRLPKFCAIAEKKRCHLPYVRVKVEAKKSKNPSVARVPQLSPPLSIHVHINTTLPKKQEVPYQIRYESPHYYIGNTSAGVFMSRFLLSVPASRVECSFKPFEAHFERFYVNNDDDLQQQASPLPPVGPATPPQLPPQLHKNNQETPFLVAISQALASEQHVR